MSVFEHVVYHSACLDPSNPSKPTLEIDAVIRDGDVDDGPVLLPWADFVEAGRIVDHLDVKHLAFPLWTAGDLTIR